MTLHVIRLFLFVLYYSIMKRILLNCLPANNNLLSAERQEAEDAAPTSRSNCSIWSSGDSSGGPDTLRLAAAGFSVTPCRSGEGPEKRRGCGASEQKERGAVFGYEAGGGPQSASAVGRDPDPTLGLHR